MSNNNTSKTLEDYQLQHKLIAKLLSQTEPHPAIIEFERILNNDFLDFANMENSLAEEASLTLVLQELLQKLKTISVYPDFYSKKIIAVAGGFSTGKSEFITSFFQNHTLALPSDINPTTAIPTYILSTEGKDEILGYSSEGCMVDLLAIHPQLQKKLSHDFIQSFDFNLKKIMPHLFLSTNIGYKHLCFIDTPGYNPSNVEGGYAHEDKQTSQDYIKEADAVLWFVATDSSGTIANDDLEFLQNSDRSKPLYIVLNKADLRPEEYLEEVIDEIYEQLADNDINIAGISAYSSINHEEKIYRDLSIYNFLDILDVPSPKQQDFHDIINYIENKYKDSIQQEQEYNKSLYNNIHSLELDIYQIMDQNEECDKLYERITELKKLFKDKSSNADARINQLSIIMQAFHQAINHIFKKSFTEVQIPKINYTNNKAQKILLKKIKEDESPWWKFWEQDF